MAFRQRIEIILVLSIVSWSHGFIPIVQPRPSSLVNTRRVVDWHLQAAANQEKDEEFWKQQKALINEMTGSTDRAIRAEQKKLFAKRRGALVADTAYIGFFVFCALWIFFDNPFVAFSYGFGTTMGIAYAYGLGKYVESLGKDVMEAPEPGEGVGQARFAFLIILFIIVGKFRASGLIELPASKFYCLTAGEVNWPAP